MLPAESSSAPDSETRESPGGEAGGYAFLCQRAQAFLLDHGGAVHEDRLISHVFGNSGTPALWRPLLRRVLGESEDLVLRPDGFWSLPSATLPSGELLVQEFVAVDVETTGLRPLHQRVIEVALIRYRDGLAVERFETFCNPDRRIPKYIVGLTGITDAHVAEAPRFAEVAEQVTQFIGNSLLAGHNVGFDISFLNGELKRIGRPALINDRLDTLRLATRLLAKLRKPSLDSVATAVGLQPRKIHRAGADAELTGEVLIRLLMEAANQGHSTLADLKAATATSPSRPRDHVGRGRAVLDKSLLAEIPKAPGVYLMKDAFSNIIYVGKAKNLRDRVSSYYSQPLGYTRKMDGLLEAMVKIDVEVVGSELEALILESQLIKRYQPRYNTALRSFEQYPYIRVDISNPWPRVTLTKARKDDGARYFGPFRSTSAARKTVEAIGQVVPLRTCSRSFKNARSYGSPCLQLDLGRCAGPCVGRANRDEYMGMVRDVVRFLDGQDEALLDRIWNGLEEASERLDFERARRLRDDLRQVNAVVSAQRQLREAAERSHLLLVLPSAEARCREVLLVVGGRIWAQRRSTKDDVDTLSQSLAASWGRLPNGDLPPVDQNAIDETNILLRWLARNDGHPAVLPLPPPPKNPDWDDHARAVWRLSDAELVVEFRALEEDEIPVEIELADDSALVELTPDEEQLPAGF